MAGTDQVPPLGAGDLVGNAARLQLRAIKSTAVVCSTPLRGGEGKNKNKIRCRMSQGVTARTSGSGPAAAQRAFFPSSPLPSQEPGDVPGQPGSAELRFGEAPRVEDGSEAGTAEEGQGTIGTSCQRHSLPLPGPKALDPGTQPPGSSPPAAGFGQRSVFVRRINRALLYSQRFPSPCDGRAGAATARAGTPL